MGSPKNYGKKQDDPDCDAECKRQKNVEFEKHQNQIKRKG